MPIQELRDVMRPRSAGRLRLGRKSPSGAPQKVEFFIFDPLDKGLVALFRELYGDQPTSIDVCLPHQQVVLGPDNQPDRDASALATIDQVFPQWRRYWKGSGLFCQGDGVTAQRATSQKGVFSEVACGDDCPFWQPQGNKPAPCKYEGNLSVQLWKLPTLDFFQVRARLLSIVRLNSDIKQIYQAFGRVTQIPMRLFLTPQKVEKGVVQVLNLAVESQAERIAIYNKANPSALLEAAPEAVAALPPKAERVESEVVEEAPQEAAAVDTSQAVEQAQPHDSLDTWETPPPEELSSDPQEGARIVAYLNAIRASLQPQCPRYEEIKRVLLGQDPQRPHTVEALDKVWEYLRARAPQPPAQPPPDDTLEGIYQATGTLLPASLAQDPHDAHRAYTLLQQVRREVIPKVRDPQQKRELMWVCLGCSPTRPRTPEQLDKILKAYR